MSVKERILAINLMKKEKNNKKFFDAIGVLAKMSVSEKRKSSRVCSK